jgi:multiple sugar transport system permease protein
MANPQTPAGSISAVSPRASQRRPEWQRRWLREEVILGYGLLAPAILILAIMIGYPALSGIWFSFHNKMIGFADPRFIGLDNYAALIRDPAVWKSIGRSLNFAVTSVAFKLPLGLGVALLLNQNFRGRGLTRGIVLLPWSLPLVVSVLIWSWMYSDLFGIFNSLLMRARLISEPINFLGDPNLAMPSVIAVNIWRGFPFFAINLLAGLQSIPEDLYEAGRVDGASRWQLFRHITLPGLRTVILIITLLSFIWTINDFTSVWVLTRGGPGTATEVFPIVTYKIAFIGLEVGKAAALPVMLLPFFTVLIVWLTRTVTSRESES